MARADAANTTPFPSTSKLLLPSRAYLLSVKDQTIPARRLALEDSRAHFDAASEGHDPGLRDMALLGLIGDAMQALEDVAYIAEAFEKAPLTGLAHYVAATVYSGFTPTAFYESLHKWPDERYHVFANFSVRDRETQVVTPLLDLMESRGVKVRGDERQALSEAADATVELLKATLNGLATAWKQLGRYFHAYKHGGLVIHREDLSLVADDGAEIAPSIAVWYRRKPEGVGHGDTNLTPEEVAREAEARGHLAVDLVEHIVNSNLALFNAVEFDKDGKLALKPPIRSAEADDGTTQTYHRFSLPWKFWFAHRTDVSEETLILLQERFGIVFDSGPQIPAR
jgi:hypothetical protein